MADRASRWDRGCQPCLGSIPVYENAVMQFRKKQMIFSRGFSAGTVKPVAVILHQLVFYSGFGSYRAGCQGNVKVSRQSCDPSMGTFEAGDMRESAQDYHLV